MKNSLITIAITIGCFVAGPTFGQEVSLEGRKRIERAEDMETFGTILLENLQKVYSPDRTKRGRRSGGFGRGVGAGDGGGGYGGGGGFAGGYGGGDGGGGYGGGGGFAGGYGGGEEGGGYGGGLFEEEGGYGGAGGDLGSGGGGFGGMSGSGASPGMGGGGRSSQAQSKLGKISTPIAAYLPGTGVVVSVDVPTPILPWEELYDLELGSQSAVTATAPTRWQKAKEKVSSDRIWAHGHWMTKMQCANCHEGLDFSAINSNSGLGKRVNLKTKPIGPSSQKLIGAIADAMFESAGKIRNLDESESINVVVRYRRWKDAVMQERTNVNSLEFGSTAVQVKASAQRLPATITVRMPSESHGDDEAARKKFVAQAMSNAVLSDPRYTGELSLSELFEEVNAAREKAKTKGRGRGGR